MQVVDHKDSDYGKKVWLSRDEVSTLLNDAKDSERRIGYGLAALSGLRTQEVLSVSPDDVVDTQSGLMVRVTDGKGDKYRETPIPETLATTIRTVDDYRDDGPGTPIVSVSTTRGLRKWLERRREKLAEREDEPRWEHVSWHDLRRTWASSLSDCEVSDRLVMQWGGWDDLETFLDHYEGKYSPAAQKREREKVNWL